MSKRRPTNVKKYYKRVARREHKEECLICGSKKDLSVHHVDGNWRNNNADNLVFLCVKHHRMLHSGFREVERHVLTYQELWTLKQHQTVWS